MSDSLINIQHSIWLDKEGIDKILINKVGEFEYRMEIYYEESTKPILLVDNKVERLQMIANDLGKIPSMSDFM